MPLNPPPYAPLPVVPVVGPVSRPPVLTLVGTPDYTHMLPNTGVASIWPLVIIGVALLVVGAGLVGYSVRMLVTSK